MAKTIERDINMCELLDDKCCKMCSQGIYIEEDENYPDTTDCVYCKLYGTIKGIDKICEDYQ